jgi:hypothetical protein
LAADTVACQYSAAPYPCPRAELRDSRKKPGEERSRHSIGTNTPLARLASCPSFSRPHCERAFGVDRRICLGCFLALGRRLVRRRGFFDCVAPRRRRLAGCGVPAHRPQAMRDSAGPILGAGNGRIARSGIAVAGLLASCLSSQHAESSRLKAARVIPDQRGSLMSPREQPACLAVCHPEDLPGKRRRYRW